MRSPRWDLGTGHALAEAKAEIERLKGEVKWWREASDSGRLVREKEQAVAEIERLKDEGLLARCADLTLEIERLRVENEKWKTAFNQQSLDRAVDVGARVQAEARLAKVVEALILTQNVKVGSYASGWTVHLTGEQMKAIHSALAAAEDVRKKS